RQNRVRPQRRAGRGIFDDINLAAAVVAEDVLPAERCDRTAIDVAADDGADAAVVKVVELRRHAARRSIARRISARVRAEAFALGPLEILPGAAGRLEVDFLVRVLSDVADQHVAGLPIDAEAERIAKTPVEDFGAIV